jgi:hypothetical protein
MLLSTLLALAAASLASATAVPELTSELGERQIYCDLPCTPGVYCCQDPNIYVCTTQGYWELSSICWYAGQCCESGLGAGHAYCRPCP